MEMKLCDTTMTPRLPRTDCGCDTYPDNLGRCLTFEEGGRAKYCVYCDHSANCHKQPVAVDHPRTNFKVEGFGQ